MGFVTCKNIGLSLIEWIKKNGGDAICAELACPDKRLKSVTHNTTTGIINFTVGVPGTTVGDVTHSITVTAANLPYNDAKWFLNTRAPTVQAALDQLSDFLSTAFGKDIIPLNNPVFYVRTATGKPNPPIEDQGDLTEANAFDTFRSMFDFIRRSFIFGTVTVDVAGTIDAEDDVVTWTQAAFKNASLVTLRGKDNNKDNFKILSSGKEFIIALLALNGSYVVSGVTFDKQQYTGAAVFRDQSFLLINQAGTDVTLREEVKFTGSVDTNAENIPAGIYGIRVEGGKLFRGRTFGDAVADYPVCTYDITGAIDNMELVAGGGSVESGPHIMNVTKNTKLTRGFSQTIGGELAYQSDFGANTGNFIEVTGAGKFDTPFTVYLAAGTTVRTARITNVVDTLRETYPILNGPKPLRVDKGCYLLGKYGDEFPGDPRISLA